MSLRKIRHLQVVQKTALTDNMLRIVLGGEALADFPEDQESAYIKLLLSNGGFNGESIQEDGKKPTVRSYTVRAFNRQALTLTLDFVLHGEHGPAGAWASQAQVGTAIAIDGPGPAKLVDMSADWFFLAGDMTALPAISVNLEKMPRHARGYGVIEILSEADKQVIDAPPGIDLHWVINPVPAQPNTLLVDAVKELPWLAGDAFVWVATEFDAMRHLRRYFKKERQVSGDNIYISSYWKMGETDEGNKAAKKRDIDDTVTA